MRFSPTRIVLAALAFIVGAVLALPMLLSRKAEAGDAPPKLEAEAGAGWHVTADFDAAASPGADAAGRECGVALESDRATAHLLHGGETGRPLLDHSPTPLAVPRVRLDRLAYVVASPPPTPWPDPQTLDRQRKYHLRP